jgi:hypothetical protein
MFLVLWCVPTKRKQRSYNTSQRGERGREKKKENVLDRYSPFDRTERVPISVRKHRDRSRLPFQRRRNSLPKETQRQLHNKPTIQNGTWTGGEGQTPTL